MNRETWLIGAGLMAIVVAVLGVIVYLDGREPDGAEPAVAGPGRATEARQVIADIQERRASQADGEVARPAAALINPPDDETQQTGGGAVAVTPDPVADAPTGAGTELDAAYERALELQAAGQLDDAQVLLFFGARQGHGQSAYAYAELNDPNHHSPETSLLAEPDAFQAFRWYSTALDAGIDAAAGRLNALRDWAETAAAAGDSEAERLLLQWE